MRHAGLLLLLCLAGCVNGNRRVDALPYAPDRVDGSYRGWAYLTSAPDLKPHRWWAKSHIDSAICPHTTFGVFEVGDRTLYYAYAPNLIFSAPVATDGSIRQVLGSSSLNGSIAHNRLRIDIRTPVCTTRFYGHFELNHS